MEDFFAKTSSQEIISDFMDMGYTFVDIDVEWNDLPTYKTCVSNYNIKPEKIFQILQFWNRNKKIENCLTSDYLGSFFLLKIAL